MADTILNYLIKAEWQGKDSARKAKQDIEGLGKTGITARNGLLELQAGLSIAKTALGVAGDAAQEFYSALKEGAQLEVEREKFDALANSIGAVGDALLGDLQAATGGMVTNSDLVRGATDLMNLGLVDTADETVRWATAVSSLNLDLQVLGLTLANDSTARLDSLNLSMGTVNQKTEKFIALGYAAGEAFDMAVLEALEEKMELFGDKSQTTAGKLQILETSWANITDRAKVGLAEGMAPTIESLDKEINLWDQLNEARDRGIIGDQFWITMILAEGIPGRKKFNEMAEGYVSVLEYQIYLEEMQIRNAKAQVDGYQYTIDAYAQLARNEDAAAYALEHMGWVQEEAYSGMIDSTAILEAHRERVAAARGEYEQTVGIMQSFATVVSDGYGAAALAAEDSQARQITANAAISESYRQTSLDVFSARLAETVQEDGIGAANAMIAYQEALGLITPEEAAKLEEVALKTEAITTATGALFDAYMSDGVLTREEMELMGAAVTAIDEGTQLMSKTIIETADADIPKIVGLHQETSTLDEKLGNAGASAGTLSEQLGGLPKRIDVDIYVNTHGTVPDISGSGGGLPEPRATGGPVTAGVPYVVGEKGPEIYVPGANGYIMPNGLTGGRGYAEQNIFNITAIDPKEVADKVSVILARRSRLNAMARV